jgi:hypothetical protein
MLDWSQRQSALLLATGVGVITLGLYLLNRTQRQAHEIEDIPEYSYKSFQDASREIRLILLPDRKTILGPNKQASHRYQVQIFPAESAPPFEAISYTWGAGPHNEIIYVQNQECQDLELTSSFKALHVSKKVQHILHSRDTPRRKGVRWIWIDSVCINQKDNHEKSLQVPQMGEIYRRASKVIICLDDPIERTPIQFRLIMDLLELWSERRSSAHLSDTLVGPRYSWRKLAQLLCHPYWARVWIMQETAIPRRLYILAEGTLVTWDTFTSRWAAIRRGPGDPNLRKMLILADFSISDMDRMSLAIRQISDLIELRAFYQSASTETSSAQLPHDLISSPPKQLRKLLYDSRKFLCYNPRDKVFGLLGLLGNSEELRQKVPQDLLPDYNISTEELYTRVARWFCASGLYPTELVRSGVGCPRSLGGLPSWVPDRTSPPAVYLEETLYSAGGASDEPVLDVEWSQCSTAQLKVSEAFRVGRLTETLPQPMTMDANGPVKFVLAAAALAERRFQSHIDSLVMPQSERRPDPEDDTLWRTLIMDCDVTGSGQWYSPAPKSFGKGFAIFYEAAKVDPLFYEKTNRIPEAEKYLATLPNSNERTFGVTEPFGMAMVPPLSKAGDEFFVIKGIRMPVLLRRVSDISQEVGRPMYQLVGDAYLHGMMKGEALLFEACEVVLV